MPEIRVEMTNIILTPPLQIADKNRRALAHFDKAVKLSYLFERGKFLKNSSGIFPIFNPLKH